MVGYKDDIPFEIVSKFTPTGDQGEAISKLVEGIEKDNKRYQVLQGATGTGKTFTMANVIEKLQRPSLIIVHNKTLAAQLYAEFKELFPNNRVEYFISNFDFYRPEAYMPATDTYVEKEVDSNSEIEMMRASAVNSLLGRRDTIVVASVASLYGLTDPDEYADLVFDLRVNEEFNRKEVGSKLVQGMYLRNDFEHEKGTFSLKGDTIEIVTPSLEDEQLIRISLDFDIIESIDLVNYLTGEVICSYSSYQVYPCYEHASTKASIEEALVTIKQELLERVKYFDSLGLLLESQRIMQRTMSDIENLRELGYCSGLENYSRHFDKRKEGEMPFTLFDYFPDDLLVFIDESHVTIPQIGGMYLGDRSRKKNLVDYGFRLPSAYDNRPLKFDEFETKIVNCICTSATPGDFELEQTNHEVVDQIIRPTGLLDPEIEVRYNKDNGIYDLLNEIKIRISKNQRTLVVAATIKNSEALNEFFKKEGIKVGVLNHEVKPFERSEIIYKLRKGIYDCIVGINLLREGLDIPEVSLIAILDSDKAGFLRSTRSLIQIVGRAARNSEGKVIMYCDEISQSMKECIAETDRRRAIQMEYNKIHNITPKTIEKPVVEPIRIMSKTNLNNQNLGKLTRSELESMIKDLEKQMKKAAKELDFEKAAEIRDYIIKLKETK